MEGRGGKRRGGEGRARASHLPRVLVEVGVGAADDPEAGVRLVLVLPASVVHLELERCGQSRGRTEQ